MKVAAAQIETAVARTAETRTENADGSAFKAALAQAATEDTKAPADITLRDGEAMKAVEGHAYSEVTKGGREGMFINTSGNVRHGEAFVLVRKNGKEYHIYGSGKDRLVVGFHMPGTTKTDAPAPEAPAKTPATDLSDIKLRKGEKIEPVEGHAYAEITSGPRSGMYINTSDNERRGDAFVLVVKEDIEHHIYGSGADRHVIAVERRKRDDES